MSDRPPTLSLAPPRWVLGAIALLLALAAIGCGSDSGSSTATTIVQPAAEQREPTYTDPAILIAVELGHRFAIMLPADPGSGWRWVLVPVDTAFLIPLGSTFSDDPDLSAQTSPSVTAFPTTTTWIATTLPPDETTTTTTEILPLSQLVSFAGRAVGTTTVTFRYEQIGTPATSEPRTATFTVQISPATTTTTAR
jgi:hypothetical protein